MSNLANSKRARWRGDGGNEEILGYELKKWRKRIVAMAGFISEYDKTVMDLGAGHMHLRKLISERMQYLPVDYYKTADDTIVCDFNKSEFPDRNVDVIVAAGILEYIENLEWFIKQMTLYSRKIIISYKGKENFTHSSFYTYEIIDFLKSKDFILTGKDDSLSKHWTLIACFEKATPHLIGQNLDCTGCGACVNICPVDALSLEYDMEGFLKPVNNEEICIKCNRCIKICPEIHGSENKNMDLPTLYAAWAPLDFRLNSSSGGIFTVFAKETLAIGGVVYGATWDENFFCYHKGIEEISELTPLKYSKYVQSNTKLTFREVKENLKSGRSVLYVGCPCQIAGLRDYLNDEYNNPNLLTVDLICFCVPSNQLFQKYIEENYGIGNVSNVIFRHKEKLGWNREGYKIELKDGRIVYPDASIDFYQRAYHSVLMRNDVCEDCKYSAFPRQGDITLGDFWGIERFDNSWDDKQGTSVIALNSLRGYKFFERFIKKNAFERLEKFPLECLRNAGNRIGTDGRGGHTGRKRFSHLLKTKGFNDSVNMVLNEKFDIGLCVVFNRNIGNNLTNYALYHVIKDMGYQVLLIDAPKYTSTKETYKEFDILDLFLKNWVSDHEMFLGEYKSDYDGLNEKCTEFLLGSDQLWRNFFVEGTDFYTCLDFVGGYKYKIAYGTSLGVDFYEGDENSLLKMKFLMERFQKIGVREKTAVDYLNKEFNIKADLVLDPVFLCDHSYYERLAFIGKIRLPDRPYTASYILDMTKDKSETIRFVSQNISDSVNNLILDSELHYDGKTEFGLSGLKEPSVEEWLASVYNCNFFITDSFHGVCFALIFHKPFLVIFDKDNWRGYSRIINILSLFRLENRLIDSFDNQRIESLIAQPIDYSRVDEILQKEIKDSKAWLESNLKEGMKWKGRADNLDMVRWLFNDEFSKEIMRKVTTEEKKTRSIIFLKEISKRKGSYIQNWRGKNMLIVGWGAGNCFQRNIKAIKEVYDLQYICDKDPKKWGYNYSGVKCISPKELSEMGDVAVVIMIDSPGISFQVAEELIGLGIEKFDHIENWLAMLSGKI